MSASSARRAAPRVFISYSHDSEEHRAAVLDLAQRLRGAGLDVKLDRYVTSPHQGWPRWMLAQVEAADFVLVVCTPTYRRRFDGKEQRGKGLGATFEGLLALQLFYEAGAHNLKFVPVLFAGVAADRAIPLPLRPFTHFRLLAQLDELVEHLHGRAGVEPAPLGATTARRVKVEVRSDGAREVAIGREDMLSQLLLSLFDVDDFRRWIGRDPECGAIAHKLPGPAASSEQVVGVAIDAMVRQGLVDAGFFERLLAKFSNRADDIRRVAALWGHSLASPPGKPLARPRPGKAVGKKKGTAARRATSTPSVTIVHEGGIFVGEGSKLDCNFAARDMFMSPAPANATKARRTRR